MTESKGIKSTAEETARRRDAVVTYVKQGYSNRQIARALGVRTPSVISMDIKKTLGRQSKRPQRNQPYDPEPYDWRDPNATPPQPARSSRVTPRNVPAYRKSTTLQLVADLVRNLEADNAVNRLANDAADAERAEDSEWFSEAHAVLSDAYAYLNRLREVLTSDTARDRGMRDWRERDDLNRLRAVPKTADPT